GCRALHTQGVEYVLVGAVAIDVLGIGRVTQAIYRCVRPSAGNVARLRRALRSIWNDPSIDEITAGDLAGDYPVVQYIAPDGTQIDIMSRLGTAFAFDDLRGRVYAYGDVAVVVATPETLYSMKRDTIRSQD